MTHQKEMKHRLKISNSNFVHTHCHSEYSQFDGLCPVRGLAMKAREMGFPAIALTDHGSIGGWIKFLHECSTSKDKKGKSIPHPPIKPLLGCELYLSQNRFARSREEQPLGRKGNGHIVLIAKNWKGYQNICQLSNASWVDGFYMDPRIDFDILSEHSEGVIASSACLKNILNQNLLHGRYESAKKVAAFLKDIYGEDFFLEVMYHGIDEQRTILSDIFKIGAELDIPIIATNDVHYLEKAHASSHEVLMCMSVGRCLNDPKRMKFPFDEFYMKSAEEMAKIFNGFPQVLSNTLAIAERVDIDDIRKQLFGGMRLPSFKVPEEFESPHYYLRHLATKGLEELGWDKSPEHLKRFNRELDDIQIAQDNNGYDFATYFLIVRDYTLYAKENGILPGPGRGSGYGSVVLRCLGVTYGPDPLEYGLLWERFLGFASKKFIKESDFFGSSSK